ncbi:MAG: FtsX-like permease family protein, partial [Pedobacter sp.]
DPTISVTETAPQISALSGTASAAPPSAELIVADTHSSATSLILANVVSGATVDSTILILVREGDATYSVTSGLDAYGIPYDLVFVPKTGFSLPVLNTSSTQYKDGKKEISTDVQEKYGDENYIALYNLKLLAGKNITHGDTSTKMIINETYAKLLGFKNPADAIGHNLERGGNTQYPIIGIVKDFYQSSLHSPIKPLAITSSAKYNNYTVHVSLKGQKNNATDWKKAVATINATWKNIYPDDDIDLNFFDESIARFYENEQRISKLLAWSTGLSVFISCLGLLGLAIYTTNLRTKEIGIRKVLGSTVTQIVALLSKELVLLVGLAFVLVAPFAWWAMNSW